MDYFGNFKRWFDTAMQEYEKFAGEVASAVKVCNEDRELDVVRYHYEKAESHYKRIGELHRMLLGWYTEKAEEKRRSTPEWSKEIKEEWQHEHEALLHFLERSQFTMYHLMTVYRVWLRKHQDEAFPAPKKVE